MHPRAVSTLSVCSLCVLVVTAACKSDAEKCARDPIGSLALCEQACQSGTIASCLSAAHVYDERFEAGGQDAPRSAERAVTFYEKACNGGESEACWAAVRGPLRGPTAEEPDTVLGAQVPDSARRRRALLEKGCTLARKELCREAADALLGYEQDRAVSYAGRYCELQFDDDTRRAACVAERTELANGAYRAARGCEQGTPGACRALGRAVSRSDGARARAAFEKECKHRRLLAEGSPAACVETSMKDALAPEFPAALALPELAPDAAVPSAVVILRDVSLVPTKPASPSPEVIRATIDRETADLATCYRRARIDNPELQGTLTLQLTIDGLGDVWDVRANEVELKDMRMVRCVVERAGAWRFPAPTRDTIAVRTSFTFRK